jgi:RNA polymerase sigma-70 factor (ECF subfamily)
MSGDDEDSRHDPTDADLLTRTARGDDAAFTQLVARHIRASTLLAAQLVGDRDEAEDIVQRAFIVVLARASTFDRMRPFPPWLFGIVRRLAQNQLARVARRRRLWRQWRGDQDDRVAPSAASRAEARGDLEAVARAASALPEMQRACFELVAVRGLSPAEVAAMHGISESTVRQHVFRARQAIASAIGETNAPS